ncbi:hypothetical protein [Amycolatopsis keratiniphila]|uniref:Uncharacterized protein n=1 Tax=Amycolatopsis keratiniphila subsp. keratiniphila TaxID=227715 RepID=A0A1W2M1R4_9PSEU|nr:hypothetical protein [Amycolatopsis keratiniphila]ONF73798.1 hypothetical protein AVR91_0206785 [Amycolatopsis keratiniphila subsp. keratiniphila]
MAEIMTFPETPVREGQAVAIVIEDDATPFVRLIGRTLRDSSRIGHAQEVLGRSAGTVAVRSHDTPQSATIAFRGDTIAVTGGVVIEPDATVFVDLRARFASVRESAGAVVLAADTLRALTPPLPHWRAAARHFWAVTREIPGIPDVLIVEADGSERQRFGDGATEYLMAGPADLLAGFFSGADDFAGSLAAGLRIKGTLAQMSVMTAASWKVRFDV